MKKFFAMLLCLIMVFTLFGCGETAQPTDADTNTNTNSETNSSQASVNTDTKTDTDIQASSTSSDFSLPEDTVPNLVIAIDQIKERAVIYDFDAYEDGDQLEDLEIWSLPIGHAAGIKYREDTVFGDVVIVGGSKSAIYEYPSGREIWSTNNPGNNTHSIEILPSGNIVLANSTGNSLRMFAVSALLKGDTAGAQQYVDYELNGAHGVLWDPEYDVLWALGGYDLVAYFLTGSGVSEKLNKDSDMGCSISGLGYGHDLQPDYTDTRYLYFTAGNAYRFDKETNKAGSFPYSSAMQLPEIKGFGNNQNGKYVSTGELGGAGKFFEKHWKESWLTDTILYYTKKAVKGGKVVIEKTAITSESSAFYKLRFFCGQYQ